MTPLLRQRLVYFTIALFLILIGLPARLTDWYPTFVVIYVGDVLWALMLYFLFAGLFPKAQAIKLFMVCLADCWLVEFSQLYRADWINEVRHWPVMGLLLGYGFRLEDLVAYTIGVATGFAVDSWWIRKFLSQNE